MRMDCVVNRELENLYLLIEIFEYYVENRNVNIYYILSIVFTFFK